MTLLDARGQPLRSGVVPEYIRAQRAAASDLPSRILAGGRISVDQPSSLWGSLPVILPPPDFESNWRKFNLDRTTLDRLSATQLMELLADLSPEVSRALWDFLRFCNPGFELVAYAPGTENPSVPGQAALDSFRSILEDRYGSMDVPINRLFFSAFLRGAFFAELVLDEAGRTPLDLATPDPAGARFRRMPDPALGQVWQVGQWQSGRIGDAITPGFVVLDRPTVRYVPVDPFPGSPYGRPLASPALFTALFLIGLLHDLRRVVAQQGYPRLDLSIDAQALAATMPPTIAPGSQEYKEWVDATVTEIAAVYGSLEPDDAYVHLSFTSVNKPVGATGTDSLGAIDGLIQGLERFSVRALKTMPLLLGLSEGVSEANANRQWEIHAAGIKSLQHLCESVLGRLFELGLRAQGIVCDVEIRFAELRAAEMMRDAQTEALIIDNALKKYLYGWQSHEASAQEVTGHAPPDGVTEPISVPSNLGGAPGGLATANPEPGANRAARPGRRATEPLVPLGAELPLPALPTRVDVTDADIRKAVATFDVANPEHAGLLDAAVVGGVERVNGRAH